MDPTLNSAHAEDAVTKAIIGAALEVHRVLGPGLLESIYEDALCHEMELRRIRFERQRPVDIQYKGVLLRGQRLDLIVEDAVVVEIKSLGRLPDTAMAQVLSYLHASGLRRALLMNFGAPLLKHGITRISL